MNAQTPDSLFSETLDFTDPRITEELVSVFSGRLADLASFSCADLADPDAVVADLIAGALAQNVKFSPDLHPSFEAWLYSAAVEALRSSCPASAKKRRLKPLIHHLAAMPHNLTSPEIAAVLNKREYLIEKTLAAGTRDLSNSEPEPAELDLPRIHNLVRGHLAAAPLSTIDLPGKRHFPLQETLWLLAGLGVLLIGVIAFARSGNADKGVAIFPSPTPPLPFVIGVESPDVRHAPVGKDPTVDQFFQSTMPRISDNGEYVVFMSSHPFLVPADSNQVFDIFLYDFATARLRNISTSDDGRPMTGESYYPALSSDGLTVAFVHLNATGTSEIRIREWQGGRTEIIPQNYGGEEITTIFALNISGDGNTVAFLAIDTEPAAGTTPASDACADLFAENACADLYIWQRREQTMHRINLGQVYWPWFETLPLTSDGRLVGLSVIRGSPLWERLGTDNEMEAVAYDWAADVLIPLNRTAAGDFPAGRSKWPDLSGSGRYAIYIAETGEPGTALFWLDLESGERRLIAPPDGEVIGFGKDENLFGIEYGNQPSISLDGSQAFFFSLFPAEQGALDTMFCGNMGDEIRRCMAPLRYIAPTNTVEPVDLRPYRRAGTPISMIRFPVLSADGSRSAIAVDGWEYEFPCVNDFCSTIWADAGDGQDLRLLTVDYRTLPNAAANESGWYFRMNLLGTSRWVKGLAVDPLDRWVAAGDQDGTVRVYDTENFVEKFTFTDHTRAINALAASRDGTRLAAAAQDSSVMVWNMDSGSLDSALFDHPGMVLDLAFSPDGSSLAVGSMQALWIWTRIDEEYVLTNSYGQDNVSAVAYSPDGKWLALAQKNEVWIRSVETGRIVARLGGHTDYILDVAFSPIIDDGYTIATSSKDNQAILWRMDLRQNTPQVEYLVSLESSDWVYALAFSPEGESLATGSFDSIVNLWAVSSGIHLKTLQQSRQDQILALAFSPGGDKLFAGTVNGVRVWQDEDALPDTRTATRFFTFTSDDYYNEEVSYPKNWFQNARINEIDVYHSVSEALSNRAIPGFLPPEVPDNFTLEGIYIYRSEDGTTAGEAYHYVVTTNFQPARFSILRTSSPLTEVDWPVSSLTEVVDITVSGFQAEAVHGGWGLHPQDPSSAQSRPWNVDSASIWLRWQDGDGYFSIFYDQPFNRSAVPANERIELIDIEQIVESLYP